MSSDDIEDLPEQLKIRREKRQRLIDSGSQAYPVEVSVSVSFEDLKSNYENIEPGHHTGDLVSVSGRVMFIRITGKLVFASLQNGAGSTLQAMLSLAEVGQEKFDEFKSLVDIGDIISVTGEVISSQRGELSILAHSWIMAAKSLRPLPVMHKELSDESRVRNRVADLIINPAARENARIRPAIVAALRHELAQRNFIEVETPMLQTLHGGAAAKPFITHSNALDIDLYLRIAPELFLKRCLVGGFERVFEINRNFRNEGIDSSHSPEFAMLEWYQTYSDYNDAAKTVQEIIQNIATNVFGSQSLVLADGSEYDFSGTWLTMEMYPSLSEAVGEEITPQTSVEVLTSLAKKTGLDIPAGKGYGHGKLVEELWEHLVGSKHNQPFFIKNFPIETSPLTREHRDKPGVVEKWDLYVRGFELATAYSELIDPVIQRERFADQARLAAMGDDEAMVLDEEFLTAMEYAMPPSSGLGMGIDRLIMAYTGRGIRDTILFPIVKPSR